MSEELRTRSLRIARYAALFTAVAGAAVLLGWALHADIVTRVSPAWTPMRPNTAVGLMLSGTALFVWLLPRGTPVTRAIATGLASVVLVVGLLTVAEHASGRGLGIDELLFPEAQRALGEGAPGRMAPETAMAFVLIAASMLAMRVRSAYPSQVLAAVAACIALLAGAAYVYGVSFFASLGPPIMAANTAVEFLVLTGGVLLGTSGSGLMTFMTSEGAEGVMLRRLLPAIIVVPYALGSLIAASVGLGRLRQAFGWALLSLGTVLVLAVLTGLNAGALRRLDRSNRNAVDSLRASQAELRAAVESEARAKEELRRAGEDLEAKVRERTAQLAEAQRLARLGSWELDLISNVLEWSDEAYRIFEIDPERFGASYEAFLDAIHPGDREAVDGAYADSVRSGRPYEITHRLLMPDGRVKHVHESGRTYYGESGQPLRSIGTIQDITERVLTEEQLRAASRYARSLIEASLDPLVTISPDGKVTDVNEATERATGLPRDRLVGTDFCDYFTQPDKARAGYLQVLSEGIVRDYPLALRHASGSVMDVLYNAALYRDEAGHVEGVFAAARDVTKRKRAEDELRRLNEELDRRVRERTLQLEDAVHELEAFNYSVSHDLRTPLRALDGFSAAVLEDYDDKLDEDGRRDLERIRAAAGKMGELIDGLLGLSRLSRAELRLADVDLSALAGELADELLRTDPWRHVDVVIEPGAHAVADRALVRSLLENLLANAWKYTSHHDRARVEFGTEEEADGERGFFVRDDGAGFDMAYADKLFVAFQRLHPEREFPGIGIGLVTVARIVHRHGGQVWAEGEPEGGATFHFTLGWNQERADA